MHRLLFKKEGRAKFISHLDLMRTFQRMFIRSGVPIKHTEGFNPHPYVSVALPLSVGTESVCELLDFHLLEGADMKSIPTLLNSAAPEGIVAVEVYESDRKVSGIAWLKAQCRLEYDGGIPEKGEEKIAELFAGKELFINKKTKRGESVVDIAPLYSDLVVKKENDGIIIIEALLAAGQPMLSPAQLVDGIRQNAPELAPDFASYKRIEIFDKDRKIFR